MVEVVVAAVIFSLAAAGLFVSFTAIRQSSDRAERRVQAAYIVKQLSDELRAKVDQGIWDDGSGNWNIFPGNPLICNNTLHDWPGTLPVNPVLDPHVKYTCENNPGVPAVNNLRKVTFTITYNVPQ